MGIKEFIENNLITARGHVNPHICKDYKNWFEKNNFTEELEEIINLTSFLDPECEFKERVYCIRNNITERKVCAHPNCSNFVRFHNSKYQKFCSFICRSNSEETKEKISKTVLEKYGAMNFSKSEIGKKILSESLKNNENLILASRKSLFNRHRENFIKKVEKANLKIVHYDATTLAKDRILSCNVCDGTFVYGDFKTLFQTDLRCPFCFPKRESKIEREIATYIESLGFTVIRNYRSLGFEIDVFVPEKKIGIEIDGLLWHSFGPSNYHYINKTKEDPQHLNRKTELAKQHGITLLHFTDKEIETKRKIVESIITSKLGLSKRIFARKCIASEISHKEAETFLKANHLHGKVSGATKRFGLFYENKLVMVITFCKPRFSNDCDWELLRLCTIQGFTVVGGFSKLLMFAKKNGIEGTIKSFVDRRFSDARGYKSIGFKYERTTPPNYFYWNKNDGSIVKRYSAQKHKLPKLLKNKFNKYLTETENMYAAGYRKFFDCGNDIYLIKQ